MRTSIIGKLALVAAVLIVGSVDQAMAQGRGGRGGQGGLQIGAGGGGQQNQQAMQQAIQRITQQLQEGEKVFQEAAEKAEEVRQEWQKVDGVHKTNLRELAQAKKNAEEEAKNLPELKTAKDNLEALRGELAEVRKKVIETLKAENENYQKAVKVHEETLTEQKANSGSGVSADTRRALAKKVSDADKSRKTIEDVVMADNSEAKELNQKIKEATAELGAASKKKAEAIESDPTLSSAKVAFQRSRDDLKKAKADLDQASGEANRIRSAMLALTNQRVSIQNQQQQQQRQQQQQQGNGYGR
ncbi:MAG: hypothetical protein IAG10_13740 [Planctomycetaceae bacterium]|nr:hypothetical protein [Planctomycetaceae bacterium]